MKKFLAILLAVLMCAAVLTACGAKKADGTDTTADTAADTAAETHPEKTTLSKDPVRVFTLKGPPGMGMAKLISDKRRGITKLRVHRRLLCRRVHRHHNPGGF